MAGHHPVGHGKSAPDTPIAWVDYWTDYYNGSRQLKKASQESWNATREVWKRKLVQAQENTLSEVHRNYEAVAQNLRLRTRKRGPEGEHSPTRQDEKNNLLDCLTFSLFSFSAMRSLTSFVTSAAGRGLPGLKQIGHRRQLSRAPRP